MGNLITAYLFSYASMLIYINWAEITEFTQMFHKSHLHATSTIRHTEKLCIHLNTKLEPNLHIKCNHLSPMHPPNMRLVIRGGDTYPFRVYSQHIFLCEPRKHESRYQNESSR